MSENKSDFELGPCKIDLDRTIRFVKQDLKDDWFLDPLRFEDRIDRATIADYFRNNIRENNGVYKPVKRLEINIPKQGFTLRYSLETCFYDRVAYHAFGEILIRNFDKLLHRRVFNHRLDVLSFNEDKPRYLFLNSIFQWQKFEEFVRVGSDGKTVLQTDGQNYYESIRIADLKKILLACLSETDTSAQEKTKIRFCVDAIINCLKAWSYSGSHGLPQNRDISSFLASIYLRPVDSFMIDEGYDYYRYMDDIRIICNNKYEARKALKQLIKEMRKIGLNVNAAKTKIYEPDAQDHPISRSTSFALERIDALMNSGKKPIVAIAFKEVRDRLAAVVSERRVSEREFRFLIPRISKIALCKDIAKPKEFFKEITDDILTCVPDWPHVSDQFYTYLVSVEMTTEELDALRDYLLDAGKSIYGWQNYLLWKVLTFYEYSDADLIAHAKQVVERNDNYGDKAGAILYLGRCGRSDCENAIVEDFPRLKDFFLQRHALIALQKTDYAIVREKIQPYVLPESRGIYRTLKSRTSHKYIEPPEKIKYSDLIREVSFYA